MPRAKAYRSRPILDLLKAKRQSSNYETNIPSKRPRYLDVSASNSTPRQETQISGQLKEGEIEGEGEEERYEDNNSENMNDYYAEVDSDFIVSPRSEAHWRKILHDELSLDHGNNRQGLVPRTDGEFANRYNKLKIGICQWAFKYFSSTREERYELAKLREHCALVPYIDMIAAAAGPNLFWVDIIETMTPRLVMGIVMKVIQLIIFGEALFGASKSQNDILNAADKTRTESDRRSLFPLTFKRQKIRASIISSFYPAQSELPNALHPNILIVMTKIVFLLKPLLTDLGGRASRFAHSLAYLLVDAARLHFDMRREPDTVYFVYSAKPGDLIDDHIQFEAPLLPTYNKPKQGDPKQRIHIVLAPGIMALRKFGHPGRRQFQTRTIADVMAVVEWVNDDQIKEASKLSQNLK